MQSNRVVDETADQEAEAEDPLTNTCPSAKYVALLIAKPAADYEARFCAI